VPEDDGEGDLAAGDNDLSGLRFLLIVVVGITDVDGNGDDAGAFDGIIGNGDDEVAPNTDDDVDGDDNGVNEADDDEVRLVTGALDAGNSNGIIELIDDNACDNAVTSPFSRPFPLPLMLLLLLLLLLLLVLLLPFTVADVFGGGGVADVLLPRL
jgi:hypothetical protein